MLIFVIELSNRDKTGAHPDMHIVTPTKKDLKVKIAKRRT